MAEPLKDWVSSHAAVIICDMWDLRGRHHCMSATERIEELAPAINRVTTALRDQGALIIHAPSGCMGFYEGDLARKRAVGAAHHPAPVEFSWNWPDARREPLVPELILPWGPWTDDPVRCSCDRSKPSCISQPPVPPERQTPSIDVLSEDAVTDRGQEIFNLLADRDIDDVLIMGVHANICVLSRDFGIRQLVYVDKRPVLCRDLTDSFHRHPDGHLAGNRIVVDHIERHWCPTVTSDELVGGSPFTFEREGPSWGDPTGSPG